MNAEAVAQRRRLSMMELTANGSSAAGGGGGGGERGDTNFLTPLAAALHSVSTTCLASDRNPLRPLSLIHRSPSASCLPTTTDAVMLSLPNGVIASTNRETPPVSASTSPAHQNGGIPAGTGDGSSTAGLTQPSALVPTIMVTPASMETPPGTPATKKTPPASIVTPVTIETPPLTIVTPVTMETPLVTPAIIATPPTMANGVTPVHLSQNELFQVPTLTPHDHHPLNKAEGNDLGSAVRSHSRLMQKREDCDETAV